MTAPLKPRAGKAHSIRLLTVLSLLAAAAPPLATSAASNEFSANEAKGVGLSSEWRSSRGVVTRGPDGKVVFLYGETQPSVICSPLQVCDIELQAGEVVRDLLVGDTVRWKVEPATSGPAESQRIHLVVKPTEGGLTTSMVVTTSRRTYHIQLRSHVRDYMARVGFEYPEDVSARLADVNARMQASVIPGAGVPAERLDFAYGLSGNASWRPSRVYSDGTKTYIQFPRSIGSQDAPVLFVTSGGQDRIVNYRMRGDMMIVDYHVDRAVLVSGTGWRQEKVTIRRGGR